MATSFQRLVTVGLLLVAALLFCCAYGAPSTNVTTTPSPSDDDNSPPGNDKTTTTTTTPSPSDDDNSPPGNDKTTTTTTTPSPSDDDNSPPGNDKTTTTTTTTANPAINGGVDDARDIALSPIFALIFIIAVALFACRVCPSRCPFNPRGSLRSHRNRLQQQPDGSYRYGNESEDDDGITELEIKDEPQHHHGKAARPRAYGSSSEREGKGKL